MKNLLKALAKSVLMPLGLTAAAAATTEAIIRKNKLQFKNHNIDNFKQRKRRYHENG